MSSYNTRLEDLIDHYFIANEELQKVKQLGGVGYLINGYMCIGIYEDYLVVRVEKSLAHTLIKKPGIDRFLSDDTSTGEFIMVESKIYNHAKALDKFLSHGVEYSSNLSPKTEQNPDISGLQRN